MKLRHTSEALDRLAAPMQRLGARVPAELKHKIAKAASVTPIAAHPLHRPKALEPSDQAVLEAIASGTVPIHQAIDALVDLVDLGKLTPKDALLRVDPTRVSGMYLPAFEHPEALTPLANGQPVSPGSASGIAVFDPQEAAARAAKGESVILVIREITPEEVPSLKSVNGVICSRGDETSHTSVVAREYGKPAVNSAEIDIDRDAKMATAGGATIAEGDHVSIDGRTGEIFTGLQAVVTHAEQPSFQRLLGWAKSMQGIGVRANADMPPSVERAMAFGADGIGLVRTEHMFFGDRLKVLQAAILAFSPEMRREKLAKLEPEQADDFANIFRAAKGTPVSIRLMDPPLHEFLPELPKDGDIAFDATGLSAQLGVDEQSLKEKLDGVFGRYQPTDLGRFYVELHQDSPQMLELEKELGAPRYLIRKLAREHAEANPMMGLRGVRLAIAYPEFYEMQARAIFTALAECKKEGIAADPHILVPLVNEPSEIRAVRAILESAKAQVEKETGQKLDYQLGAMVETPAGALNGARIGALCDFISFGTNDLTASTFMLSRDDARPILEAYKAGNVRKTSPFESIDPDTVGELLKTATTRARHSKPRGAHFEAGICGEQGASPSTIAHARGWGVDYVSVSPYRIGGAIIASAQENLRHTRALPFRR